MREIIFDTETTGLSARDGDRLVEIGCVELVNRIETGRTYHCYYNPERSMPQEAFAVHGLSETFLSDKPKFASKADELLEFLEDSPLVAHNAGFDFSFLNAELEACGRKAVSRFRMVDTVHMARQLHPGSKHSLDALCNRYGIDRSHRIKHGALLDAELLAQLYIEMTGGRQIGLTLDDAANKPSATPQNTAPIKRSFMEPRPHHASEEELARHAAFLASLTNPLWLQEN